MFGSTACQCTVELNKGSLKLWSLFCHSYKCYGALGRQQIPQYNVEKHVCWNRFLDWGNVSWAIYTSLRLCRHDFLRWYWGLGIKPPIWWWKIKKSKHHIPRRLTNSCTPNLLLMEEFLHQLITEVFLPLTWVLYSNNHLFHRILRCWIYNHIINNPTPQF